MNFPARDSAHEPTAWTVTPLDSLDAVLGVLAAATEADGIAPLSDGILEAAGSADSLVLALTPTSTGRDGTEPGSASAADSREPAGVAVAALQGTRWAAEAVIAPAHRGTGLGRQLVAALADALGRRGVQAWFWSHGDHPAAAHLAAQGGYGRARELLQLSTEPFAAGPEGAQSEQAQPGSSQSESAQSATSQHEPVPAPQIPDGIALRSVTEADAADWARVNNAAFSWHPEQGDQPVSEYAQRLADPGFDRDSVVIAERTEDGAVAGFHETKMHADHPSGLRMGEVYVIAVDPDLHARGLGRALLLEGMRRLVRAGAQAIELYVESDNASALPLYRSTGFTRTVTHVSYQPPEDHHAV